MNKTSKLKKGGLDSIVAFIVILLPLVYILIFMVATLYHFSVQMYVNQVVKETLVMASTYGNITSDMETNMVTKLSKVMSINVDEGVKYYVRPFKDDGTVGNTVGPKKRSELPTLRKADLIGIYVISSEESLLGSVSRFNIFGGSSDETLFYSAYREEIIRNEAP